MSVEINNKKTGVDRVGTVSIEAKGWKGMERDGRMRVTKKVKEVH